MLVAGLRGLLAGAVAVVLMLAVYVLLPAPNGEDSPWLIFVVIMVITVVFAAAAVEALLLIDRSQHPMRTGFVMLAVMLTAMVVAFALAYLALGADNPDNFNVPLGKVSALYFTMTILSTVGFGDILATSDASRIVVMIQMAAGLTLITALARVLVSTARSAARRRHEQQPLSE